MSQGTDTIYALSSGSLPAGVAVVRLSGPNSLTALRALLHSDLPPARKAALKTIRLADGAFLDRGLVLTFPAPASFTGEDCVELQLHGGRAVIARLMEEFSMMPGLRYAEAGEFTRRAFDNGKIDLVEAEGLADLLASETEMQRRLAVEQSSGRLSDLYNGWSGRLSRARALIEAELDFADEDDVPGSVASSVWSDMQRLADDIEEHLAGSARAEIIRDGFVVALSGPPNVGKSSLMNALAGRDVAIVTDIAGTTRDILSVDFAIDGYLVRLLDTAGIRDTDDPVEKEGVKRALAARRSADMVLMLSDGGRSYPDSGDLPDVPVRVRTKADLLPENQGDTDGMILVSTVTGAGIDTLKSLIADQLSTRFGSAATLIPARERHRKNLQVTLSSIRDALSGHEAHLDMRAEALRMAGHALGKITGRVDVEDLLGIIFSEFCIGK